jgi:uncharacterized membrane protein
MTTSVRVPDDISSLVDQAKHPVTPAAGPYGHPFHPILVTVPIGAWVGSLVFDIATKAKSGGSQHLAYGSSWLIAIGLVGAVLAALFGLMDLSRLRRGTAALKVALTHMVLNLSVTALYAINLWMRHDDFDRHPRVTTGQLVLSLVSLGLLGVSGWLGGQLAYKYGVRVAHETDQAEGYRSTGAGRRT